MVDVILTAIVTEYSMFCLPNGKHNMEQNVIAAKFFFIITNRTTWKFKVFII